jgi:hypothetical protein
MGMTTERLYALGGLLVILRRLHHADREATREPQNLIPVHGFCKLGGRSLHRQQKGQAPQQKGHAEWDEWLMGSSDLPR